jgi:hypothetical protein
MWTGFQIPAVSPKRQRTGALQNWRTSQMLPASRQRLGVRQSSAAFPPDGRRTARGAGLAGPPGQGEKGLKLPVPQWKALAVAIGTKHTADAKCRNSRRGPPARKWQARRLRSQGGFALSNLQSAIGDQGHRQFPPSPGSKLRGRASWRAVVPASPCSERRGGSLALPISSGSEFFHSSPGGEENRNPDYLAASGCRLRCLGSNRHLQLRFSASTLSTSRFRFA